MRPKAATQLAQLLSILKEVENHNDSKPEGQNTEPDVIVIATKSLL
jgi:hypothetical protein